jgi:L,D-peptidoglycan transpeptidase YkuD (ErfK/YbiS/YcfS/YnhG family)
MRATRALATGASLAAVVLAGALIIGVSNAQPHGTGKPVQPLAAATSLTPSTTSRTYPVPSPSQSGAAIGLPTTAVTARPAPSHSTARPAAPATHSSQAPAVPTPATTTRPAPAPSTAQPPSTAPVRGQSLPLSFSTGTASQVVTVVAGSTGSTTATLQAWDKAPGGGWQQHGGSVLAHVGSDGLTTSPSESRSATPIGSFTLTQAFGSRSNPGTALPYIHTDAASWWISTAGPAYNTYQHCSTCGYGSPDEQLSTIWQYGYALVIDYNRWPVQPGAGSAFFVHITDGGATAGCVSIPENTLVALMHWLAPSAHPRILIGVP